jgi:hypothetical protein
MPNLRESASLSPGLSFRLKAGNVSRACARRLSTRQRGSVRMTLDGIPLSVNRVTQLARLAAT